MKISPCGCRPLTNIYKGQMLATCGQCGGVFVPQPEPYYPNWREKILCLFGFHDLRFKRTIHGDEIINCGWKRSVWDCIRCEKIKYKSQLDE